MRQLKSVWNLFPAVVDGIGPQHAVLDARGQPDESSRAPDAPAQSLMKELRVDLPLHILTALYLIGAGAFAITVDAVERLVPAMYLWLWIRSAALCLLIYLLAVEVPISVHLRSRRPLTDAVVRLRGRIGSRALPGLALLLNLGVFYGVFTSVKNMLPLVAPHWQDREIADLSQSLHLGHAPWKLLHVLLGYPVVTRIIEFLYVPV